MSLDAVDATEQSNIKSNLENVNKQPINSELLKQYDNEAMAGRGLLNLVLSRQKNGFTPYIDIGKFPDSLKECVSKEAKDLNSISTDDIAKVSEAKFGIMLETAAQISEVNLPRGGPVREDLGSLKALYKALQDGNEERKMLEAGNTEVLLDQARNVMARRSGKSADNTELDSATLKNWVGGQFDNSLSKIKRSLDLLSNYLR
jgi:hypothetical protein